MLLLGFPSPTIDRVFAVASLDTDQASLAIALDDFYIPPADTLISSPPVAAGFGKGPLVAPVDKSKNFFQIREQEAADPPHHRPRFQARPSRRAFLFFIRTRFDSFTAMKNFLLLLFALLILVVFGGSAYFLIDISKGARFERLDQTDADAAPGEPTPTSERETPPSGDNRQPAKPISP